MNTQEAIAKRKSTRSYTAAPVPEEALNAILQAGFAAPVAMARYDSLHITVLQNEEIIKRINDATSEMFSKRMGVKRDMDFGARTLFFVSTTTEGLHPEMAYANVGIVVENMVIAATDLGIDTVILGGAPRVIVEDEALMKDLGIPAGMKPVLGICLGYATTEEPPKTHSITVNRV